MYQYKETSHIFHAIMSLIFFPWVIIWAACYMSNKSHNDRIDRLNRNWEY